MLSITASLEFKLSTVMLYCPSVAGLVIVPVGIMKPYKVELFRLPELSPETVTVRAPELAEAVSVPGAAVMLAGVDGKPVVLTLGVPLVTLKPLGSVTLILETDVGVVLSLKVTSMSFPALALMPNLPRRTLA